jgi:hypothetical protein
LPIWLKTKIPKKKKTLVACKNEKDLGNTHFGRWTQDYVMGSLTCGLILPNSKERIGFSH